MSALTRKGFPAQYDGACISCGHRILAGDHVFYAPGNESVSGLDCCGDRDDADLTVVQVRDTEDEAGLTVELAQVMPRGRTARDACPKCWLVPANSGACGCNT